MSQQIWNIVEGSDVVGSDGEKFGTVDQVQQSYLVVRKGWFFPNDYYIPVSAISSVTDDQVVLNVTKDTALNQGWDIVPETTDTEVSAPNVGGYTDVVDRDASLHGNRVDTDETIRVPLAEEELTATRRTVERGQVRIEKDVVIEEQELDVPVTEERVNVTRRVVDRDLQAGDATFEEGTIEVPVRGEEADLQKQARVREELEISKDAVQQTERVGGKVRREQARVVDTTDTVDTDELLDDDVNRR